MVFTLKDSEIVTRHSNKQKNKMHRGFRSAHFIRASFEFEYRTCSHRHILTHNRVRVYSLDSLNSYIVASLPLSPPPPPQPHTNTHTHASRTLAVSSFALENKTKIENISIKMIQSQILAQYGPFASFANSFHAHPNIFAYDQPNGMGMRETTEKKSHQK